MHLETEHLIITEFDLSMAESVHKNSLDEDTRKFVPDEVFETIEDAKETIEFLMSVYASGDGPLVYPVLLKDGTNIGYVQLVPIKEGFEVGYHIGKLYTRNGYATEALKAFLEHMMMDKHIDEVYGICVLENHASKRVLEKCGFQKEFEGLGEYQGVEKNIVRYVFSSEGVEQINRNITQAFYDNLSSQYDKLFLDWQSTTHEQALILNKIFQNNGFDKSARILDCACGIGTQSIGLAALGYQVTGSDISDGELAEAKERALKKNVQIRFEHADFCALSETFSEQFDIVIAMDNALPHMLSKSALEGAIKSIIGQIVPGGMFVASIRDYDALLMDKPPYSPPYIHKTDMGQRVSFQTWKWNGDCYKLIQYIIDDEKTLQISKFECEYRATRREELTNLLMANGCREVVWKFPEETGFYQPIVIARK